MNPMLTGIAAIAAMAAGTNLAAVAQAQEFPSKPIEIVVPFPPGGTSDLSIRFLADKWSEFLPQPVVILNKPGGASSVGASLVANSDPDGHTLLVASETSLLSVPHLQADITYDHNDFSYLFAYGKGTLVFSSLKSAPWSNLTEFVEAARAEPGARTYASYGIGTMGNFAAELLFQELDLKVTHVPFGSSPEASAAMLGGHVDMAATSLVGDLANNPDVNILAVSADEALPFAPDLKLIRDYGYQTSLSYMNIVVGPKGIPEDRVKVIVDAHRKAYEKYRDEIDQGLLRLEQTPIFIEGDEVHRIIAERDAWFAELTPRMKGE